MSTVAVQRPRVGAYGQAVRRQERKQSRRCIDCAAGLQPEDGVRCVECASSHLLRTGKYSKSSRGAATRRTRVKELRRKRNRIGLCPECGGERDDDRKLCSTCRFKQKLIKAGIKSVAAARPVRMPTKRAEPYTPLDEIERNHRVRLLRALWWLGWVDANELFTVVGISEDYDGSERNSAQIALGRLVKAGLVEKKIPPQQKTWANYRITTAGRDEVAGYRNGVYPVLRGRRAA